MEEIKREKWSLFKEIKYRERVRKWINRKGTVARACVREESDW